MNIFIKVYENGVRDEQFYSFIGPFALNRKVTEEMHDFQYGGIYDEPYATWFIALDEAGTLLGFATLFEKPKPNEIFLDNCYVLEEYRKQGIGGKLFAARQEYAENIQNGRKIKGITKNEIQYRLYLKHGYKLSSKRGKYYWMVKEPVKKKKGRD